MIDNKSNFLQQYQPGIKIREEKREKKDRWYSVGNISKAGLDRDSVGMCKIWCAL